MRLPAVLLQAATTLLAASLARARGGRAAGVAMALLLQATPVFSLGAVLMTPDAPLALAWAGALWAVERAFRERPRWFLAAGGFLGVAALSKLHGGLLGVALLVALLLSRDGRRALAGPWVWAGVAVAVALASPMLYWNATHGWPSFLYQASHGARGREFSALRLAASIGAQTAYVSPVILAGAAVAAWRALRRIEDPALAALSVSALPVVAFFTAMAAFTPGALPHWAAPGWLSACVLLAIAGGPLLRPAVAVGLGMTGVAVAGLLLVLHVPLPIPQGPLDELRGWHEGAAAARAVAGDARLAVAHPMVFGQIAFADGRSPAYLGARRAAASFYDPAPLASGAPLLLLTVEGLGETPAELAARLGPLEPAGAFVAKDGERVVRRYRFFWLRPEPRP